MYIQVSHPSLFKGYLSPVQFEGSLNIRPHGDAPHTIYNIVDELMDEIATS